jgi:hypothetical protein
MRFPAGEIVARSMKELAPRSKKKSSHGGPHQSEHLKKNGLAYVTVGPSKGILLPFYSKFTSGAQMKPRTLGGRIPSKKPKEDKGYHFRRTKKEA